MNYFSHRTVETAKIRLLMLDFARNPNASGLAVDDYQEWCAIDWKEPQGTTRSEKRLSDKLIEEPKSWVGKSTCVRLQHQNSKPE